jgi:hypothetical protein
VNKKRIFQHLSQGYPALPGRLQVLHVTYGEMTKTSKNKEQPGFKSQKAFEPHTL